MKHLGEQTILKFISEKGNEKEFIKVSSHLYECPDCLQRLRGIRYLQEHFGRFIGSWSLENLKLAYQQCQTAEAYFEKEALSGSKAASWLEQFQTIAPQACKGSELVLKIFLGNKDKKASTKFIHIPQGWRILRDSSKKILDKVRDLKWKREKLCITTLRLEANGAFKGEEAYKQEYFDFSSCKRGSIYGSEYFDIFNDLSENVCHATAEIKEIKVKKEQKKFVVLPLKRKSSRNSSEELQAPELDSVQPLYLTDILHNDKFAIGLIFDNENRIIQVYCWNKEQEFLGHKSKSKSTLVPKMSFNLIFLLPEDKSKEIKFAKLLPVAGKKYLKAEFKDMTENEYTLVITPELSASK